MSWQICASRKTTLPAPGIPDPSKLVVSDVLTRPSAVLGDLRAVRTATTAMTYALHPATILPIRRIANNRCALLATIANVSVQQQCDVMITEVLHRPSWLSKLRPKSESAAAAHSSLLAFCTLDAKGMQATLQTVITVHRC